MEVSFDFKGDPTGAHITNCKYVTKGVSINYDIVKTELSEKV